MGISVLLNLPEELLTAILVEWLSIQNVAHLDTAYSNRRTRERFLQMAYNSSTVYKLSKSLNGPRCCYDQIYWSNLKRVCLNGFCLSEKLLLDQTTREQYFKISGRSIGWILIANDASFSVDTSMVLAEVAQWCPNIKDAHLVLHNFPDHAVDPDNNLVAFTAACTKLTSLALSTQAGTAEGIASALRHCTGLTSLSIGVAPLEVAIPSLTTLDLTACASVTNEVLAAIGEKCHRLQTLYLFRMVPRRGLESGIAAVLEGCPALRGIDVEHARHLAPELRVELTRRCDCTELVLSYWSNMTPQLASDLIRVCPRLRRLSCHFSSWLRDDTLAVCAQHCPLLYSICIRYCKTVTNEGIRALCGGDGAGQLKVVELVRVDSLDATALFCITEHCPLLESVCTPQIATDASLAALAQRCPLLRSLDVSRSAISDAGLLALAHHCSALASLDLLHCGGVTLAGVAALVEHCTSLKRVVLPQEMAVAALPRYMGYRAPFTLFD